MNDETCGHCGQPANGYGTVNGVRLCHTGTIPPGNDPPDCYRLCTVYQHATDGSCCPGGNISPWRPSLPADFDGCGRGCRMAGVHTLKWGECDHAERPPRPEPEFGYWATRVASDGGPSLGLARIPLLAVLPWAARLTVDQRHEMLEAAAAAEDPAAVIRKWQRRANARAPIQINVQPAPEPSPGYGLGHLRDAYERGRRQGRHEAGGR